MANDRDPRERPIAVFDSGVGGLTVLHELLVSLPHEDFLYLGDTARFPYGERTAAELERFSLEIAEELLARQAKLLVVACNSATAAALPALRRRMMETTLGVDVLGVVKPEALQAVATTRNGRIGLLATPATVASGAYATVVAEADPHVDLVSVACPDLAPIIQGGWAGGDDISLDVVEIVRGYVRPLRRSGRRHGDPRLHALPARPADAPALPRPRRHDRHLAAPRSRARSSTRCPPAGSATRASGEGDYGFLCTGDPAAFRALGTRFLQMPLGEVDQIDAAIGAWRRERPGALLRPRARRAAARRRSSRVSSAPRRARR